ncbi:hypothetical protein T484DRAFT_2026779 [Baffinella frigidus]|nr:hypothetical protein T484DRAFT_2026779 [Cryptophyta sp. CCMP2293]
MTPASSAPEILAPRRQLLSPPLGSFRAGRKEEVAVEPASRGFGSMAQLARSFVHLLSYLNTEKTEARSPLPPPSRVRSASDPATAVPDKPFYQWRLKARSRSGSLGKSQFARSMAKTFDRGEVLHAGVASPPPRVASLRRSYDTPPSPLSSTSPSRLAERDRLSLSPSFDGSPRFQGGTQEAAIQRFTLATT